MASSRSIEVKVGAFILTAAALLAGFVLIMGGVNFQPTFTVIAVFDNPSGLQSGAQVKIAGVKVGKVGALAFCKDRKDLEDMPADKKGGVVCMDVTIETRHKPSIRKNATFYITTQGLLGEQYLAIDPGSIDQDPLFSEPMKAGERFVRGLDPPRLDRLIAETYELLHSSVTAMRENKEGITEAFDGLRKTLKGTGEFMERNKDRLDRIAENVEQTTLDVNDTVRGAKAKYVDNPQIDRIMTNVETIAGSAAKDAPPILADAKVTMENMRRVSETVGAESEQAKIKKTLSDVQEVAALAKSTMAETKAIVGHIRRGKGTVGAMVMDEALYDDLQELARDLKHNPWKFLWRE
ncbi:MAG: MCE family protein [Polyangiaceae bacterium]|nr:MCE family protein [Polyangiaceae bacterium]